ncbi:MAG: M20/M25/M40 family metallo-hydrolase [Gemmatimonadota bacterium]|nr:M20/M25/M40 family metallo-hydrolase [Gemmatimonadota bacterium]
MEHARIAVLAWAIVVGSALNGIPSRMKAQAFDTSKAVATVNDDSTSFFRIRAEAMDHSQVMDLTSWLSDVYGPRLTGSPDLRAAAAWATRKMNEWRLGNVHLEAWGPFGRGWANESFSLQAVSPRHYPIIAYPSAWTPSVTGSTTSTKSGESGPVTAEVVFAPMDSVADFAKYHGRLRGKFVMPERPRDLTPHFRPDATRMSDSMLARMSAPRPAGAPDARAGVFANMIATHRAQAALDHARSRFLTAEGATAALLDGEGDDGTVIVESQGGSRDARAGALTPTVVLGAEDYGRLARTLEKGVPVTLKLDDQNRFYDNDPNSFNIIAEIPGSDPALKDQVVMIGAHFDSWHAATGAADNAAGSAVMMEAMRILKAARIPLKRTVRIALWTGEEQGMLGSRAYVVKHFADPTVMQLEPEHAKFDVYFNLDNGSGKIRGVFLQGNAAIKPIFDAWMEPFKGDGMRTLTLGGTGFTDFMSFDAVGLPAFQFIQDPLDYNSRAHHSNMDTYERVQADDMKWNAMVIATFAMQAANRLELVPRKPLPAPAPFSMSGR